VARRADAGEVIGLALEASAAGSGHPGDRRAAGPPGSNACSTSPASSTASWLTNTLLAGVQ